MIGQSLRLLYGLLLPDERRRVVWTGLLITVAALLQLASLSALYLFLTSATSPTWMVPAWIDKAYTALGILGTRNQQLAMAFGALALLVAANGGMAIVDRAKSRLQADAQASLSTRLLAAYLRRDYPYFLHNDSARLTKSIVHSTSVVAGNLLGPTLDLASKAAMALAIIALLLIVNPLVSVLTALALGAGFVAVHFALRPWIRRQGLAVGEAYRERLRVVAEALGGIKEAKVLGREESFVERFKPPTRRLATAQSSFEFSSHAQKYALETVAFGSILLLVAGMLVARRDVASIVPIVGLLAIAGYRLLPAFRDIAAAVTSFVFHAPTLEEIGNDLTTVAAAIPVERLAVGTGIEIDNVGYAYDASRPVLTQATIRIPSGSIVGLVGQSGAGKSTLADLIMGLMPPDRGRILVNGAPLDQTNLRRWRRNIGYVPQEIFLSDATIAENIAFGLPIDQIDMESVRRSARLAQLAELVESSFPQGYLTRVGERGVRLSGGQRQRIGIARALYNDPPVIVLDEATSDVDGATEASIAQAIRALGGSKTIIVIAHRLTAIRACDTIHFLDGGRVVASGSYEDLLARNEMFRSMVEGLLVG